MLTPSRSAIQGDGLDSGFGMRGPAMQETDEGKAWHAKKEEKKVAVGTMRPHSEALI